MGDILQVTGLYNRAPQFKFARRDSMVLSIQVEATTEEDLLKGLNHVTIVLCLQESFNSLYREMRSKDGSIGALEVRVVQQGTFDSLMEYFISRGASESQCKTPLCLNSSEALAVLENNVCARFFSDKSPPL
ncbi:unnamed protein product [Brassica oleracea var. botrytis]